MTNQNYNLLPEKGSLLKMHNFSNQSILIVGVVRNCSRTLRKDYFKLKESVEFFGKIGCLLIESDSDDDTITKLELLSKDQQDFQYVSLGKLRDSIPLRIERIARCRNEYLKIIENNSKYHEYNYVLVADFDGINYLVTKESMLSCWDQSFWDVCTANQKGPYYDILALRHPLWSPNDCQAQFTFLSKYSGVNEKTRFSSVYSRMITIPMEHDWIEVDSAFGGLALYKRHVLQDKKYIGLTNENLEICEHVTFCLLYTSRCV